MKLSILDEMYDISVKELEDVLRDTFKIKNVISEDRFNVLSEICDVNLGSNNISFENVYNNTWKIVSEEERRIEEEKCTEEEKTEEVKDFTLVEIINWIKSFEYTSIHINIIVEKNDFLVIVNSISYDKYYEINSLTDYINRLKYIEYNLLSGGTIDNDKNVTQEELMEARLNLVRSSKDTMAYRGQTNIVWDLEPSVFRDDNIYSENIFYDKLSMREPEEFNEKIIFKNLVKMQHYALPTRLMDLTFNPYIALFFACEDLNDSVAVVYVFNEYFDRFDNKEVEIFARCATKERKYGSLEGYYESIFDLEFKDSITDNKQTYVKNRLKEPRFVRTNLDNERIKRQDGAFIIFGAEVDKVTKISDVTSSAIAAIIIRGNNKMHILSELSEFGIHQGFVYPELEHQARHIRTAYKKQGAINNVQSVISNAYETEDVQDTESEKLKLDESVIPDFVIVRDVVSNCKDQLLDLISSKVGKEYIITEEILELFIESLNTVTVNIPDWDKKEQLLSTVVGKLKKDIFKIKNSKIDNSKKVDVVLRIVVESMKEIYWNQVQLINISKET